jgi:hypothetical protein
MKQFYNYLVSGKFEPNWKVMSHHNKISATVGYFRTKKDARDYLKEIYLNDYVPFFELDCHGRRDGFTFKEFLTDFKITRA